MKPAAAPEPQVETEQEEAEETIQDLEPIPTKVLFRINHLAINLLIFHKKQTIMMSM